MQILLVEDDQSLASGLQEALGHEGFITNHVDSGNLALRAIETSPPDIVILDLGLPDMDGLEVLTRLRKKEPELPVIILTARSSVEDKVSGLDLGADDYLAKPVEIPELIARLRVIGRRLSTTTSNVIQVGEVSLDTAQHEVQFGDELLDFSRREYMLLKALMENVGKIQTREGLESKLYSWGEEVSSNTVEVHIHHLRKKLGKDFIKTIRGVGYTIKSL